MARVHDSIRRIAANSENPLGVTAKSLNRALSVSAEYTKITVSSTTCAKPNGVEFGVKEVCTELHCEDILHDFPNQPVGAKIVLQACEFSTSIEYTWVKQANGKWRLELKTEKHVEQCPAVE